MISRRQILAASALLSPVPAFARTAGNRHVVVLGEDAPGVVHGTPALASERFAACSTFKIPLTLIAIEEGLIADVDALVDVDPRTYEPQPWWSEAMRADWGRPHSLRSAFASSAVWFYRRLALTLGEPRLAAYLERFDYGNRDMRAGLDNFWNAGDKGVLISANEQWQFVRKVAHQTLPLSPRTYGTASTIFIRETRDARVLRAKTGLGWRGEARRSDLVGWFVGWTQAGGGRPLPFASVSVGDDAIIRDRVDNAMKALRNNGHWS